MTKCETLSFAPKRSSDRTLSDERLGAKLRVTENRCVIFNRSTYVYICIYIYIYIHLWCKNQIEHSTWDESLLFCNCACSLQYSSLSTLAGLSYHICGKLEVAFKASPSSQHQHCTDEAQKADTVLSAVSYIYSIYIYIV